MKKISMLNPYSFYYLWNQNKEEEAMLAEIDLSGYFNEVPESAISKEPLYRTQIEELEYDPTNSTPAINIKSTEIQPDYNNKSSKNNITISSTSQSATNFKSLLANLYFESNSIAPR